MKIENLSAYIECSGNAVPRIGTLRKYIDILSGMGYTELYLGLTNAYKIESEPYFCYKRSGYTVEQLQEIDGYCASKGIELRCAMQTLAHLYPLSRHYRFKEIMDTKDILLVGDDRVYELIDKMFDTLSRGIKSRHIHIGFDEAFGLGTGKYFERHGYIDRRRILLEHLKRIQQIAKKYGLICDIWHDTLMDTVASEVTADDIKRELPEETRIFYWNYRQNDENELKKALLDVKRCSDNVGYCGSAFKICGFGPQNRYSISRLLPQIKVSGELGIKQFIVSSYSDRGAWSSFYSVLPAYFVAAEYAHGRCSGIDDVDRDKFYRICGVKFDDMISLDYLNNPEKKDVPAIGNRSGWMFMSDPLVTSYDMFTKDGTGDLYELLAEEYDRVDGGQMAHVFEMSAAAARVLATKSHFAARLRDAYERRDRAELERLVEDSKKLEERLVRLNRIFTKYWKKDYFATGVEVDHLYLGYNIIRTQYIRDVIIDFIENDTPIDELSEPALLPSVDPAFNEDNLFVYEFDSMLTHGVLE